MDHPEELRRTEAQRRPVKRAGRADPKIAECRRSHCCRRKGSSLSFARRSGAALCRFAGPAVRERGGDERQKQFMVSRNGKAAGNICVLAGCGGRWALHYILQRTVVLNEIEVCRGDWPQWHAEISNDGDGFQENFRQEHGGTPIEIYAARVHSFHERAEEAKVEMRGCAERGSVRGGMHVRNISADGEMNGDRYFVLVSGEEDAGGGVSWIELARGEEFSGGFAIADAGISGGGGNFVEIGAGFAGHAKSARAEARFDVFGRVAAESDFEIVDEGGAVHGDAGDETAADEIVEDGTEARFDDVAAHAPKDGFAGAFCRVDGGEEIAEIVGGEEIGERVEKIF